MTQRNYEHQTRRGAAQLRALLAKVRKNCPEMATYTHHPKRAKNCVFCKFWIGNAIKNFKNSIVGYEYDGNVSGKCTKMNGAATPACHSCSNYAPSPEAERLL